MKELAAVLLPGGVGETQIRIIEQDNPRSIKACFTEFFNRWRQRVTEATWQKLIDALVETKKTDLAEEIREALIPSPGSEVKKPDLGDNSGSYSV